jgi:hypothetical protein
MYDYLSIEIDNTAPDVFLNNPCLVFHKEVDRHNEHIPNRQGNYIQTAYLSDSLQLVHEYRPRTNKNIIKLKGSFHKHAQTNTNYGNYTLTDFERTANELSELLQINTILLRVRCFEFGVNINPSHDTNEVLNAIICHRGNEYEKRTYNGNGYLKRFVNAQYEIKIYNKSKQYNLSANILRYEIKVLKMDFVNKKLQRPINTVPDLLNPEVIAGLSNILINSIDNLYMYDYRINPKQIKSNRDKHTLIECINPAFWELYRGTHTPTGYKKKVKRFRELVRNYAPDNLQTEIKTMVLNQLTDLQTVTQNYHYTQNRTVTQNYPYIVSNNSALNARYCLTCGRDITHQKTNSRFCSEKIHGPRAKKCRNKLSNLKRDEKRKYNNPLLFDVDTYLQPEYRHLKTMIN